MGGLSSEETRRCYAAAADERGARGVRSPFLTLVAEASPRGDPRHVAATSIPRSPAGRRAPVTQVLAYPAAPPQPLGPHIPPRAA